jgi:hypothetical protein
MAQRYYYVAARPNALGHLESELSRRERFGL